MLCIIFTGTKVLAGINGENLQLLHFGTQSTISYQGTMVDGFQAHFPSIVNAYHLYHNKLGSESPMPIPLILIVPASTSKSEKHALIKWIRTKAANTQIVFTDTIANQYVQHLKNTEGNTDQNHLVADATGQSVRLSIVKALDQENNHSIELSKVGWESSRENLLAYLITHLAKEGWIAQSEDEAQLRQKLQEVEIGEPIHLSRKKEGLELKAAIQFKTSTWYRLLAHQHELLKKYFSPAYFETHNLSKLILIGKYFENNIILNYICNTLNMESYLMPPLIQGESKVFNSILANAFAQADTIDTTLIKVQQRISHLPSSSVTPLERKDKPYISTNHQLVKEKDLVHPTSVAARPIEPLLVEKPSHPINYQTERNISATVLEQYFDIDELYSWKDHLFFRGAAKGNQQDGVIRFVATPKGSDDDPLPNFRKLHQFESGYYEAVGLIQNLKIGHFYRRPFIEGETLDQYIKNSGIYKKRKIKQLNTSDLKIILQIWKEINGLNFACKYLQEANILVQSQLKWNLSKSINIRLVGFNTSFCSKAAMIEDFHKVFERQFGQDLYAQIRKKFNI